MDYLTKAQETIATDDHVFVESAYSWAQGLDRGRNKFVSFERRFEVGSAPDCELHLFADSRYRLFVNGAFVAYGPGRFVTAHPEYDSYDLSAHLRTGENLIRVEVNYYGGSSFQTMPDGMPGFIAAGSAADGAVSLATPGDWPALVHQAWDSQSPYFSFAQNPAEICDTRVLMIQEHYGFIRRLGHPTLPETFNHADHGSGSCCHSWSGAPAIYATEYVLGLKLTTPGNPDRFTRAPVDTGRDHAEGILPHRRGPIHVKWRRHDGHFVAAVAAPPGVSVTAGPSVELANHELREAL